MTKHSSKKTDALCDEICRRLSEGEPLRQICRDERMPHFTTVYDWIQSDEDLCLRIARARELGADAIADDILSIVDDARNDWVQQFDDGGNNAGWKFNAEHVQRSRLRVETRLKLLAKWFPQKYGDKQRVEHSGAMTLRDLLTQSSTTTESGGD